MKACGVPWTLLKVLREIQGTRRLVSKLYLFPGKKIYPPLTTDSSWLADIPELSPSFDCDEVWVMVLHAARNPDHQQIHLNLIHRTYMTPRELHSMKLKPDPN